MTDPAAPAGLDEMSPAHRAYVIAMCAVIAGAFGYAACDWGRWPHLVYLPLQGRLALESGTALAIHYLGLVAWGLGGACAGAVVGAVLCRVAPRRWSAQIYRLFGAWAITAILLAGGYFTWSLWPW